MLINTLLLFVPSTLSRIPIVWDDMLRNLLQEELGQLAAAGVEPMVWWYGEDIYRFIPTYTWDRWVWWIPHTTSGIMKLLLRLRDNLEI